MKAISLMVAVAFVGCSGMPKDPAAPPVDPSEPPPEAKPAPVPDSQLGLSKTSVTDVPDPPAFTHPNTEPGESKPLARSFYGAPPLIPHEVQDFLPISVEENNCLACHELGPASDGDPPAIPPSHATDLRGAPDKVTGDVVGARWRCVACHLPQAEMSPLVENTFSK